MDRPPCCTLPPDDAPIEAAGYAAYNAGGDPETAGLTFQGKPCPEWDGLTGNVRAKWASGRREMLSRFAARLRVVWNDGDVDNLEELLDHPDIAPMLTEY